MLPPKFSRPCSGFSPLIVAALASLATAITAPAALYTFEGLSTGTLAGQDNWVVAGTGASLTLSAGTGFDTSLVAHNPGVNAANFTKRQNNGTFSFGSFTGAETNAVFQFDVQVNYPTPGQNQNFSLSVLNLNGTNGSPSLQYGNSGGTPIARFTDEFGAGTSANLPGTIVSGDWVRLKLAMDFTANAGNGLGSVSVADLTQGSGFAAVTGMQNMALNVLGSGATPSAWDTIWTRTDTAATGLSVDNLLVSTVPEPAAASIGLGLCVIVFLGSRRRYRRQAM